jgi:hypothetical protein
MNWEEEPKSVNRMGKGRKMKITREAKVYPSNQEN